MPEIGGDDGGVTETTGLNWSAKDALVLLCVGMTNGSVGRVIASYDPHNHEVLAREHVR